MKRNQGYLQKKCLFAFYVIIQEFEPELTEKGLQFILMGIASDFVICEIIEKILQIILIGVVVWLH